MHSKDRVLFSCGPCFLSLMVYLLTFSVLMCSPQVLLFKPYLETVYCAILSFCKVSSVSWCFNSENSVTNIKRTKSNSHIFPCHSRSRWQPSSASHWWFGSHCHHPTKWNRPQTPEVFGCKWNTGIGFSAQPGKCLLGSVYRVLWATPLCRNEKSAWIHTGTWNKNTTKFATYVFLHTSLSSLLWFFEGLSEPSPKNRG